MRTKNKIEYPTQDEAQMMVDWYNSMHFVYTDSSDISDEYKEAWKKADDIRISLWTKTFGTDSPWRMNLKRNLRSTKGVLVWDKEKAEVLGL